MFFFKRIKLKKRTDELNNDPILVSIISKIELLKLLSIFEGDDRFPKSFVQQELYPLGRHRNR